MPPTHFSPVRLPRSCCGCRPGADTSHRARRWGCAPRWRRPRRGVRMVSSTSFLPVTSIKRGTDALSTPIRRGTTRLPPFRVTTWSSARTHRISPLIDARHKEPRVHTSSGLFSLRALACAGRRSAPHQKPPAMRVGPNGFTKPPPRRTLAIVQAASGIRVERAVVAYGAQKAYSLSHTKWMCKYHVVFTPKYRRKVIYNQIRSDLWGRSSGSSASTRG